MNKIREKLLDFKKRLSDRHMYSIVIVVIAVIALFGVYQLKRTGNLRQELDNQYNRAFFEMSGYVQNVEVLLMKALIASSSEKTAETLQDAWYQANMAQTNLGQLPITQDVLSNTSKFLSQVGDLAYSLNLNSMYGKKIDDKQYQMIETLHTFAVSLEENLNNLEQSITSGRIRWEELSNKGTPLFKKTSENLSTEGFSEMDKTFQEYPTLIYDGPFSDHMTQLVPRALTGDNITEETAKELITKFIGKDKVKSVDIIGRNDTEPLKTFNASVKFNNRDEKETAVIDITQKGGHILWMLFNRPVGEAKLDINAAKKIGLDFLTSRGIKNMKDTYFQNDGGVATINYAYSQGEAIVYPDLIKVKIALDDGEVVGFESKGYIMNHTIRELPTPSFSEEEIKNRFSDKVEIKSSGLAIIPTEFATEKFVYELKGRINEKDFIVYVNTETGLEEEILIIIDTPNGILTL